MNPEDNQPTEEPMPSLDQVAADLAANPNAAADMPAQPVETETPAEPSIVAPEAPVAPEPAPVAPEAPIAPEPPLVPETPTAPEAPAIPEPTLVAPEAPVAPEPAPIAPETPTAPEAPLTPETPLTPEAPIAPETPISGPVDPTTIEAPVETPAAAEPVPAVPEEQADAPAEETPNTESTSITSANFVGDAPEAPKAESEPSEDEEPLQPAEPVPGSIGSALVYSETAPNHAMPVSELKKQHKSASLSKENIRMILIIVAAVALVATLVVVLIFIFGGSGSSNKNHSSTPAKPVAPTPVVSSLTCNKSGTGEVFPDSGSVTYGEEDIIAMYSDDELTSLGSTMKLEYGNIDDADAGLNIVRGNYSSRLEEFSILSDPFNSSYDVNGSTLTVTHQAEIDDLNSKTGKIFNLMSVRGEVVTDIETLQDSYEEDGYECVVK